MTPDDLDEKLEKLYQNARLASSEGLRDEALDRCEDALALLESFGDDTDHHSYSDFVMLMGDIYWASGDWEQAFEYYQRVALNDPERNDARVAMGVTLYHLCRFHAAQTVLEMCSLTDQDDPEVWYYLALLALRGDKRSLAMYFFDRANELHEDRFIMPVEVEEEDVIDMVNSMIAEIPEPLMRAMENVPIVAEDRPSEELLLSSDPPMDPTVLGLFTGIPHGESSSAIPDGPTQITLFLENIWLLAGDRDKLEEELWITLKHEIGHYFGLSEEELTERGLD